MCVRACVSLRVCVFRATAWNQEMNCYFAALAIRKLHCRSPEKVVIMYQCKRVGGCLPSGWMGGLLCVCVLSSSHAPSDYHVYIPLIRLIWPSTTLMSVTSCVSVHFGCVNMRLYMLIWSMHLSGKWNWGMLLVLADQSKSTPSQGYVFCRTDTCIAHWPGF